MSSSFNQITLIGRIGRKEMHCPQEGEPILFMTLSESINRLDKKTSKKVYKTQWHSLRVVGKLAEFTDQYQMVGQCVFVQGKLIYSTDEKKGAKNNQPVKKEASNHKNPVIYVNHICFLSPNPKEGAKGDWPEFGMDANL